MQVETETFYDLIRADASGERGHINKRSRTISSSFTKLETSLMLKVTSSKNR